MNGIMCDDFGFHIMYLCLMLSNHYGKANFNFKKVLKFIFSFRNHHEQTL